MEIINLSEKFSQFHEHWNPKVIGRLNGQAVKLVKLKGEFVMHRHENEDELFYVIEGVLKIKFEDKTLSLQPGEMLVIPRGTLHKPIAEEEVKVLLFEPESTLNTGDVEEERTRRNLESI